jgi:hypothetical protein
MEKGHCLNSSSLCKTATQVSRSRLTNPHKEVAKKKSPHEILIEQHKIAEVSRSLFFVQDRRGSRRKKKSDRNSHTTGSKHNHKKIVVERRNLKK